MPLNLERINEHKRRLNNHPLLVGDSMRSLTDVRTFMEHHVFAVWDFMCLIKTLQHAIVPSATIWLPQPHAKVGRFINEVILGEETDIGLDGQPISHYDMYTAAMKEVGANTKPVLTFIEGLQTEGLHMIRPLMEENLPEAAETFCRTTLDFVGTHQSHIIASAFAFGRETVIPSMFVGIVEQLDANEINAPMFKYYLERHIEVDGEEHGPISLAMIEELCEGDPKKYAEAESTALAAIRYRYQFWDAVHLAILETPQ